MRPDPVTPLTEAQLAFLTEQTQRAARKAAVEAVRGYRRRAIVGFLVLLFGIGGLGYVQADDSGEARTAIVLSGRNVAVDSCNARFRQQVVLRKIITNGRPAIRQYVKDGLLTPTQAKAAMKNSRANVKALRLPDCRVVGQVITDDPSDLRPNQPPPLYPGSKGSNETPRKG